MINILTKALIKTCILTFTIAMVNVHATTPLKDTYCKKECAVCYEEDVLLYVRPSCYYCKKVLTYIRKNNICIQVRDISSEENKRYLVKHGGKQQVPCLFIDGRPLYESNDIIEWLKKSRH